MKKLFSVALSAIIVAAPAFAAPHNSQGSAPLAIKAAPDAVYFSPNGDGILDTAIFHLAVSAPQNVSQWSFTITDALGQEIKKFSGQGAPPSVLEWAGKDENNEIIADGIYFYTLSVTTLAGENVVMPAKQVICSRQPPFAQVRVEPDIFSPEEGSAKPVAHFNLQASDPYGMNSWLLRIIGNSAIKSFFGKGMPPAKIDWHGLTDTGDPAPNGPYSFTLAVRDLAGNTTITSPQTVTIDRTEPTMQITANPSIFSPGGSGASASVAFDIQPPPGHKIIETWKLSIKNKEGQIVRTFAGAGEPPLQIPWDGSGADGKILPDGAYTYSLLSSDQAGNSALTIPKTAIIDTKPPQVSIALKPWLISPNGDGFNDSGVFAVSAKDENGVAGYALEIRDDAGNLKRAFRGQGTPPHEIEWAGQDDSGNQLPDAKYTYTLTAVDAAGNKAVTAPQTAQIDTTPPVVQIAVSPTLISPSGDQKQANFQIGEQDASDVDAWTLTISDSKGKAVRKFSGQGALNGELGWDGTSDSGAMVPDGDYSCVFWTQDVAHNAITLSPKMVTVGAGLPQVSAQPSLPDFSPNADGIMDAVSFALGAHSFNKISSWTLDIVDASDIRIREFSGQGQPPASLLWGGERDDKSVASDGIYRYVFGVVDLAGNRNSTAPEPIQVDNTPPEINAKAAPILFAPKGTINQTNFALSYKDASPVGTWTLNIKNDKGRVVRAFSGSGSIPAQLPWRGKDTAGKIVPDGSYTYNLSVADSVGNKSVLPDQIVRVVDAPPQLTLSVQPAIFAPNADTSNDRAFFSDTARSAANIASWGLSVADAENNSVVWKTSGQGYPPAQIIWDGTNGKHAPFPDGKYNATFSATDEVGNEGLSPAASVIINSAKPQLVVSAEEETVPSLMPEIQTEETSRGIVIPLAAEVLFETGKAQLKPEAYATLDEAAAVLRKYDGRRILIEGYTDNVPIHNQQFPSNLSLSRARAKAVRDYFVDKARLNGSRMSSAGYGDARPVASNDTADGRRQNRRVEIIIAKEGAADATAPEADGNGR
ncbi:MAG TPA: FlgD immunoglobulin-like domain containing protein [Elusimicrobiota bacterium]|nr:FlgD immunoglobulin-like domain containing protein [Elusimicrobiota bacterium]